MPLKHAIAHHLRYSTDSGTQLSLREEEIAIEGHSEVLLDRLKSSFLARISREHGSFTSEDTPAALPRGLGALLDKECSFTEMSTALMEQLKHMAEERKLVIDAHFLFFIEHTLGHHSFYLFVANQSESLTLDARLDVVPSYAIDTGPSLFGIKVDLAEWRERQDYAYLSLLPPRGNPELAETFYELTGFANGLNKEEATMAFLEGVEAFARQMPEEQVSDYRNQVVDFCMEQDARDAPVDIRKLSKELDGIDADEFVRVVNSHNPQTDKELMMDRRSLRRYVKFAGRERDLAISFASHQLNHRIHYDADSDTLRISGIPKALRRQLMEHLKRT